MSNFGVIFCGECKSSLVDSGFGTPSTLRCCECGNEKEFRIGKVSLHSESSISLEEIFLQAKQDARL